MNAKVDELCEEGIRVGWSKAAGGNGEKLSTSYPAFLSFALFFCYLPCTAHLLARVKLRSSVL